VYGLVYIYEFEGDMSQKAPLVRDADYIGFWHEGAYSFLFYHAPKKDLFERLGLPVRSELAIRHEDWESGGPLAPLRVGRIGIHQPWNGPTGAPFDIVIDPNMAFGSGFHASTRGCLTLLDRLFTAARPARVLDLGTGTGVLSLACLKMGSESAVGIDSNNLAIEAAVRNRRLNGLDHRLHLVRGDASDFVHMPADLLIANMHFAAIDPLTRMDGFYAPSYCLVSGLIRTEGATIRERVEERLDLMDSFSENFWFTYLFKKKRAVAP
jgi:ribosomal protein L11 methyltransferase